MNVKAFLAGKCGICPECDVRFIIPAVSGGMVPAIDEATAQELEASSSNPSPAQSVPAAQIVAATPEVTAPNQTATATDVSSPPVPPPPPKESTDLLWYVRTSLGDQYGPATTDVFRRWVEEGRVSEECFVWRSDWPDWKPSSEALAKVSFDPPAKPPADPADEPVVPERATVTSRHGAAMRNRRQRAKMITMVLSALAILLLIAVVLVVANG